MHNGPKTAPPGGKRSRLTPGFARFSHCTAHPADYTMTAMLKHRLRAVLLGSLLLIGGVALAQRPVKNVSGGRHPNLAAAQRLSRQAWQRVVDAQQANEWDMQGHAQKAKDLLDQANNELKMAAQAANKNAK